MSKYFTVSVQVYALGAIHTTVRTQQLIASLKNYALSAKTLLKDPKAAARQIREKLRTHFSQKQFWENHKSSVLLAMPAVILLAAISLLGDIHPDPYQIEISKAGFFEETEGSEPQGQGYVKMTRGQIQLTENKELAKEAILWMSVLNSYDDFSLSTGELMLKFKNMGIASTILSTTAEGPLRRKYWSERAIKYGRYSLGVLEGMMPNPDPSELEEVKTRLLIAMALNYYEDGKVAREEIVAHFEKISKSFLVRTGFCNNKILKSLHDDRIIQLPNYLSEINL